MTALSNGAVEQADPTIETLMAIANGLKERRSAIPEPPGIEQLTLIAAQIADRPRDPQPTLEELRRIAAANGGGAKLKAPKSRKQPVKAGSLITAELPAVLWRGPGRPPGELVVFKLVAELRSERCELSLNRVLAALRKKGVDVSFSDPQARHAFKAACRVWVRRPLPPRKRPEQNRRLLIAAFRTVEFATGRRSIARARTLARALGASFNSADAATVLANFIHSSDRDHPWRRNLRPGRKGSSSAAETAEKKPGTEN